MTKQYFYELVNYVQQFSEVANSYHLYLCICTYLFIQYLSQVLCGNVLCCICFFRELWNLSLPKSISSFLLGVHKRYWAFVWGDSEWSVAIAFSLIKWDEGPRRTKLQQFHDFANILLLTHSHAINQTCQVPSATFKLHELTMTTLQAKLVVGTIAYCPRFASPLTFLVFTSANLDTSLFLKSSSKRSRTHCPFALFWFVLPPWQLTFQVANCVHSCQRMSLLHIHAYIYTLDLL